MAKSSTKKSSTAARSKARTPKARSAGMAKTVGGKSGRKTKHTRTVRPKAGSARAAKAKPAKTRSAKPAPAPINVPAGQQPRPVATGDSKPRKNLAGIGARELQHFRDLLLAKRRELVGDMSSMEREALRAGGGTNLSNLPIHMADMGTDNYEQEFTLGLMEKDRNLLREINVALGKIQDGTFGICEGTGNPIGKPRLEAQPWARHSIEYARQKEKGLVR